MFLNGVRIFTTKSVSGKRLALEIPTSWDGDKVLAWRESNKTELDKIRKAWVG